MDPATRDFECPLCLHVMREPTVTDCCGGHFCSGCIRAVQRGKKACPLCRRHKFKTLINKAVERKIADLRVRCPMGDRGCRWEGPMREAGAHLERETGGSPSPPCGFVAVDCPAKCGERPLRAHVSDHLRERCPKREVRCPHCRYATRADRMVAEHWVACPNDCAAAPATAALFERCRLDAHLSECPNQPGPCDFSYLGCEERVRKQDAYEHNTTKHLVAVYTLMLNAKKRLAIREAAFAELEETLAERERARERAEAELKRKDADVATLREDVKRLEGHLRDLNPSQLVHVMPRFAVYKTTQEWWEGHEFYTHPEGYKLSLGARVGTGLGSLSESSRGSAYLSVRISVREGRYDDRLEWGRGLKVTVCLVNQLADGGGHYLKTLEGVLRRHCRGPPDVVDDGDDSGEMGNTAATAVCEECFVACNQLEQAGGETSVAFVKDDCVKFRICAIEFQ